MRLGLIPMRTILASVNQEECYSSCLTTSYNFRTIHAVFRYSNVRSMSQHFLIKQSKFKQFDNGIKIPPQLCIKV